MSERVFRAGRLTRRAMIGGVVGSAAAAILAACGGDAATTAPTAAPTTAATATKAAAAPAATTAGSAATTAPATTGMTAPAAAATTAPAAAATTAPTAAATTGAAATTAPAMMTTAPTTAPAATAGSAGATGAVAVIPLPDPNKFKGQTLQIISRQEYFKGTETALDMALQDFATKINIKIENNRLNPDTGNVVSKIDASVKAGNPPDLIYFDRFLPQFVQLDDLLEVSDVVKQAEEAYGAVEDGSKINQIINGKYYSVPYFANANGWFARKDWLAEKGIKLEEIKTFENLRDVALQVSDPAKNRFGWGMTVNTGGDGTADINAVLYAYGGAIVSDDGTKVVFNSPETLQAVTFLADIYTNPKYKNMLPPGVQSWTDPSNNEAWLAGTIGFTQNAYTLYAQSFNTMNPVYKNTAIIAGFTGPATDTVLNSPGTGYLAIPKGAKNIELAKATALYLIGGPAFLALAKPSLGLIMPGYKKLWNADPFYTQGDPSFSALQQIIEAKLPVKTKTGFNFPQSPSPIYELAINAQHVTSDMMSEILQKGVKPAEAVKTANDRLVAAANQLGLKQ